MASLAEVRREEPEEEVSPMDPVARPEELRLLEALLFASAEPIDQATLAKRMPDGVDVKAALAQLQAEYAPRGVNLVRVANKWTFRTAGDLSWLMTRESTETRKLSRAAIEVLAIVAYHQPVTRAEIEEIRGVVTSKGTIDVLLETGWIRPRGRRKTPGRPLTFGTTDAFLSQFSLEALGDLPGLEELKGTGLLDSRLPTGFSVPSPSDDATLREDEEPLEPGDTLELLLAPAVEPEVEEPKADAEATVEVETTAEAEVEADVASDADSAEPDAGEPEDRADHAGDDANTEDKGE
nr:MULTISPECIES: SMC-Scp complex subunit ScpB [Bradyrhizobium]